MIDERLYFEDLTVGRVFASRHYELSAEEIRTFAAQYDPQPFHTDDAAAQTSFFNGLAASGWHTAAVAMHLMVESVPVAGGLIGAGVDKLRWFKPVRPGDTLRLETGVSTARESSSRPNQGVVKLRHTVFNQQEETVLAFDSTIVAPKKATP